MTEEPTPTPPPKPARKYRAKPADVNRDTIADIALAEICAGSTKADDNMVALRERDWGDAEQATFLTALDQAKRLVRDVRKARASKRSRGHEEIAVFTELLVSLDPILAGAKRTFPEGSGERALFGVGENIVNYTIGRLYQLAVDTAKNLTAEGNTPAAYTLKGVKPDEIAKISNLCQKYKDADFAQANALLDAAELLDILNEYMDKTLNPHRRELQLAAEQAWPYRIPTNRTKRMAFGLPPARPMTE